VLVYVHVPFCARRCSYCDFSIAVRRDTPSEAFAEAVLKEWGLRQETPAMEAGGHGLETVYFGGGTPSRLDPRAIERILRGLDRGHPIASDAEITLEANPDDLSIARARDWRALGITRISLGVQSFDPAVLQWMHRTHAAEQADAAMGILRASGFDNVSLDLIYGLPAALGRDWNADLNHALELGPEHLSLYALTVEKGTPLGKWTARLDTVPLTDDAVAREYLHAHRRLSDLGYQHYEVSNAARPGRRAVHNAGYWTGRPFLGLGPSAASGAHRWRAWNIREWEAWRRALAGGESPVAGEEWLTDAQILIERQYLGLRTDAGLAVGDVPSRQASDWIEAGWAEEADGRLCLTPEGWLRLDALVAALPVP
jgi:oxygen-independent coproporphyrinogen-3 oxidase